MILIYLSKLKYLLASAFCLFVFAYSNKSNATIFTIGTGTDSTLTEGVTPFSTSYDDNRVQYLYTASELIDAGVYAGPNFINSIAFNITSLGYLEPVNVNIKIGTTSANTLGTSFVPDLPVFFSAGYLSPTLGWNTYTFNSTFLWDGVSNIIIELCRNGDEWLDSYGVQTTQFPANDYRTYGLYDDGVSGCTMVSGEGIDDEGRRTRPNARFDIVAAPPCSGPLNPVTITGPSTICSGSAFTLSADNVTIGTGLNYEWQYFDGTDWQTVGPADTSYLVENGIPAPRDFRFITTCMLSGISDTSEVKSVATNPPTECYCDAFNNTNNCDDGFGYISNVSFNTINNSSECEPGMYADYSATQITDVVPGYYYTIKVTNPVAYYSDFIGAFFDWNHDGDFNDPGETFSNAMSDTVESYSILIPLSATPGITRMRVRWSLVIDDDHPLSPCDSADYGEVEDYSVNVLELIACTDQPAAGAVYTSEEAVCIGSPFTLSAPEVTIGTGLIYQWQSSPAGMNNWEDISGATLPQFYTTTQSVATDYRLWVLCTDGNMSDTSTIVTVAMNPGNICYCNTFYDYAFADWDYITQVTFGGIDNTTGNTPGGEVADYTGMVAHVTPGAASSFTVSVASDGDNDNVYVFFDWNQNGILNDAGEVYTIATGVYSNSTFNTTITPPADALPGITRMRVMVIWHGYAADPCLYGDEENTAAGESEDYSVSVCSGSLPTITVSPSVIFCNSTVITASGAQTYTWSPALGLDASTGASVSASPTEATTYTVIGTNAIGCVSSATVTVTPLSVLAPLVTATPAISCTSGIPVTLDVTPFSDDAGSTFEYELRDASGTVVVPWQSAASFVFTPAEEGDLNYHVFVRTSGCTETSDTGFVALNYGFDADVTTYEEDCSGANSKIIISNPEGGAGTAPAFWQYDFENPSLPAEVTLYGSAIITDGRAAITPSTTEVKGAMSIQNTATINLKRLELSFLLSADQPIDNWGTGGGDGLAWSFGDDADYSPSLTNGAGSKLRLVFDDANNGSENGNTAGIYLTYGYSDNSQMGPSSTGVLAYSPNMSWKDQTDKLVNVVIDEDSKLTMSYDGNVIFNNIQLPTDYSTSDKTGWKHLFTAFTGGDAMRHAIDDLNITYINRTFVYGISAGGSGTIPASWQSTDTFSSLVTPDSFDVWIASSDDPATCHKLLGTYRFIHPIDINAVTNTDLTTCGANNGSISLEGLIPDLAYDVTYEKDLISQSATITTNASGNLILDNLQPGVYSNIIVSVDGCSGAPLGPITIATPVKPALTASIGNPNTDCTTPNGTIILSSPGFENGTAYDIWYNGTQHGTLNADINQQITITGLAAGTYNNIYVVTPQLCNSDTVLTQTVTGAAPSVTITGTTAFDPSDCNAADGMIELSGIFEDGSLPEITYKHNGIWESTTGNADATTIQLTGLTAGVYDSIQVNGDCPSNIWESVTLSDGISGGTIASSSATETGTQGSGAEVNYSNSTCELIATIHSSDSLGSVTAIVTVSGGTQMYNGIEPYIGRFYELIAANNLGGTVTIYFTDAEINAYNTTVNGLGNPMYPAIGTNGENLRITAYHSSIPGSGPEGYDTTGSEIIVPASIVHNGGVWEITFTTSSFSGFFAHTNASSTPLPTKLTDVNAVNLGATNRVDWSTTEEARGDRFVIERSAEGKHFEVVGKADAKGISGSRYSFVDASPLQGVNYYRVEVLNNDGSRFYSKVVSATVNTKGLDIEAYPNPVKDELTVRARGVVNGTGNLILFDVSGRELSRTIIESNGMATFSMEHLPQGMYMLKFQDDSTTQTIRVNKK